MGRDKDIAAFLARAGWGDAVRAPLAGDASNRKYERLTHPTGTRAVLMDAAPETGEDINPFLSIARHLADCGLTAPKIIAQSPKTGLILMEDLGDALYDRVVLESPVVETDIYLAAWDALKTLHAAPVPAGIAPYGVEDMTQAAHLIVEWYDPTIASATFRTAMKNALDRLHWDANVLVLRDFHAQNLIWLPDRAGPARVGLLDFQDAQPGHVLYDLISLIYDARRDVSPATQTALLDQAKADTRIVDFDRAVATLNAQRNLRIMGVFARLWIRDGKAGYLDLLPRVYDHLCCALAHPDLGPLRATLANLPAPDAAYRAALKARRS